MLIEEPKRTVSVHPVILIACFVCVIGFSVLATYLIAHVGFQNRLKAKDQRILNMRKNYEALAHQNLALKNSLHKREDEYSKLKKRYETIESSHETTEPKKVQTAPEQALVLKPTWVRAGQTTLAFDGNLGIILREASAKDKCPQNLPAVSYLISGARVEKLCLGTGKQANFTYQGKRYWFNLSGIAAKAGMFDYCISISQPQ